MPIERGISSLRNLLTRDAIFRIPIYQRHYSWDKKQLEDLWNDLFYLDPEKKHFFGTILLKSTEGHIRRRLKEFEIYDIIDGQQRIITSLILLKSILSKFDGVKEEKLKQDVEREKELYLKFDDIYKVTLLGDDERFFREYVVDAKTYPDEAITPSQKRLKDALEFFQQKMNDKDLETLENVKLKIDNMDVLVYPIEKDPDAARMFTIINDRGKMLTDLEKTKSFLMYTIYSASPQELLETDLKSINERFTWIFRCIMGIENTQWGRALKEDEIQRYHYITYVTEEEIKRAYQEKLIDSPSREKAAAKHMEILKYEFTRLYREDKQKCRDKILEYVADLERAFIALKEIMTYNKDDETRGLLNKIFLLGRVGNFYPLVITCWIKFKNEPELLNQILKTVEKFVFRAYVLSRTRSYAGRNKLYALAYDISSKKLNTVDITDRLGEIILDYAPTYWLKQCLKDRDFAKKIWSGDVRCLFFEYEMHLREKAKEPLDLKLSQILSEEYEVEHIWAQDPSNLGLTEEEKKEHEECKHKLGNLTLASASWNASMGNKPFADKKGNYKDSILRVQRELIRFDKWRREQIEQREGELIEFILERWKV
jgi:hypothetical protein